MPNLLSCPYCSVRSGQRLKLTGNTEIEEVNRQFITKAEVFCVICGYFCWFDKSKIEMRNGDANDLVLAET